MPRACGTSLSLTMSLGYTFGKDRATRELADRPVDAVDNIDFEDINIFGDMDLWVMLLYEIWTVLTLLDCHL